MLTYARQVRMMSRDIKIAVTKKIFKIFVLKKNYSKFDNDSFIRTRYIEFTLCYYQAWLSLHYFFYQRMKGYHNEKTSLSTR